MADKTGNATIDKGTSGNETVIEKWVDIGGGAHARLLAVVLQTASGITIGKVAQGAAGSEAWLVKGPDTSTDTAISGQITVAEAGTAVQGPNVLLTNGTWIGGHPDNTGNVAYGNDGADDVNMSNGVVLEPGHFGPPAMVANLNEIWFDVATSGDKFCWFKG